VDSGGLGGVELVLGSGELFPEHVPCSGGNDVDASVGEDGGGEEVNILRQPGTLYMMIINGL
jgi:hypothetical protein